MKKIWTAAVLVVAAFALAAPVAGAQTAAQQGYDESGVLGAVDNSGGPGAVQPVATSSDTAPVADTSSSLPFTGLDVGILLVLGAAAVGTGYALRRVIRTQ